MRGIKKSVIILFLLTAHVGAQTVATPEKKDQFSSAQEDAKDAVEKNRETNSFIAIGPTIGGPAGLNANLSFYLWRLILRGSAGFYGTAWYGFQGDVGFSFLNAARIRHSVSFVGGLSRHKPLLALDASNPDARTGVQREQPFFGATYDLYMSGFFLQIGASWGTGNLNNPGLIFQSGYLFSFP